MKYKFASKFVVLFVLLALMFSASGTVPALAVAPAPWDTNLVTNPGAEIGNLSGWSGDTGSWAISADVHQGTRSFITTFAWTIRYQEIDLLAAGFTAGELDGAPAVMVGEWFKGFNCGGGCNPADQYYFKVELRNAAHAPIASWSAGSQASPVTATATWTEQTHTFSGYGSGLRYIYLEDGGKDVEGWSGHYGAVMDDAYAMLLMGGPIASTETASSITLSGATLNGMVNANGDSTTVTFEYGLDTSYGNTVTVDQSPLTDSTYTAVSAAITGLPPTATYHFRVKAVNGTGTTYGRDQIFITSHVPGIRYVKPVASGTGDCSSWENACALQTELTTALSGDEVWVMQGTYKPTSGTDRTATFQLVNGVALYGGFAGDETQRADRHGGLSILSGDLLGNDSGFANNSENSVHVVVGVTGATLDGFTVTGGNANSTSFYNYGGGMYNKDANPIVRNVTFSGNYAFYGGGMHNSYSSPTVTNVTFSGNSAIYGGGMYNHSNTSTITNVTFSGNSATYGGGMYNNSIATVKNVIIANSSGGRDCYGTLNAASANTLIQSAANACGLTNGTNGNIIGSDPLLGAYGSHGGTTQTFPLLPGSPAIDAGDDATCAAAPVNNLDQRGVTRPQSAHCDIGAFEAQVFTLEYIAGEHGSINGTTSQSVYEGASGTQVTAVSDANYHFVNWSDGVLTASRTDTNVTDDITVTANFAINTHTLTYTAGANGSITGTSPQTVNHGADGSAVTAVPDTGYHFVSWSDGLLTASRTDTNVTDDITVTANFTINSYTLTYTAGSNGSITGTSPQTVNHGADGSEVTAVPDANYHFVSWSDGVLTASRTDTNITGNITVIANFALNNQAPTDISLSASSVTENLPAGTMVGTLSTVDPDAGDTHTYSFCGGADDASFAFAGNALNTAAVFDYETKSSYAICVRTTDNGGLSFNKNFTITVNNVIEILTVTLRSTGTQDGWLLESGETTLRGGTMDATSATLRLGDDVAKKQYRSLLSFATGAKLPDNAVITKVTLKVRRAGIVGGGNPVSLFQGFMVDIRRGIFGTSALQITDWQATANKSYGPFNTVAVGGWYTIDLTASKAYINKLATYSGLTQFRLGFKLDDNNNAIANYLSLYSGNAPLASQPALVIEYYIP